MSEQETVQNGRVTNAILATKLDGLTKELGDLKVDLKEDLAELKKNLTDAKKDHEDRLRGIESYQWLWKLMIWAAGIFGASLIVLVYLIATGQVQIVKVVEAIVK